MKNIGTYNNLKCYTCTDAEYKQVAKSGQDNGNQIFIINDTMVRKNKIVGYYDGKHMMMFLIKQKGNRDQKQKSLLLERQK